MGTITLITDFGLRDPFIGLMKGVILTRAPGTNVVDLTHEIPAYRPEIAGFWLSRCTPWFPPATVHVAVVDPGVGSERRILALHGGGWLALAPDNGLLGPLLERAGDGDVRALDLAGLVTHLPAGISHTFHGRDVFAPLAAELVAGRLDFSTLGPLVSDPKPGALPPAQTGTDGSVQGQAVLIDRFGNLLTNVEAAQLPAGATQVTVGEVAVPLVARYQDVPAGEALALINAHGVLEIAVHRGRADEHFGAGVGAPVRVLAG